MTESKHTTSESHAITEIPGIAQPSSHPSSRGTLLISLDLELYWGVRDNRTIESYQENLQGVRYAVERILAIFREYEIHATWATVGLLFLENEEQIQHYFPLSIPNYQDKRLSPYEYLSKQRNLRRDLLFAPDIIKKIQKEEGQEIATHTFSHYYCLEHGQTKQNFIDDLVAAKNVASNKGIQLKSIVFPRNQINPEYVSVLRDLGVLCYRGTQAGWVYINTRNSKRNVLWRRVVRLMDGYINLTGYHTFDIPSTLMQQPFNFPASCFLRPYSRRLAFANPLKLRRITKAMEYAARNRLVYHLWWHPHNFGTNTHENICFLRKILEKYRELRQAHRMQSLNMGELAEGLIGQSKTHSNQNACQISIDGHKIPSPHRN